MTSLSKSWRVARFHASCYTDGNAKLDRSPQQQLLPLTSSSPPPSPLVACWNAGSVSLLDLTTGRLVHTLPCDADDEFTTFAISPSHSHLVTLSRRSSLLTLHSLTSPYPSLFSIKTTPFHSQPIVSLAFDSTSTYIATASLDRTLRIFHIPSSSLHLTLRGHPHPLHLIAFHPTLPLLVSSDTSGEIRIWNVSKGGACTTLPPQHMAALTSITFPTPTLLLTTAQDRVLSLWSLPTPTHIRTTPLYEVVRAVIPWPEGHPVPGPEPHPKGPVVVTGGEKGALKWWEPRTGRMLYEWAMPGVLDTSEGAVGTEKFIANQIGHLFLLPSTPPLSTSPSAPFHVVAVTMEQNFHLFSPTPTFHPTTLYIGHNDEILDLRLHPTTPHILTATNSPQVRVFHSETLQAQVLSGHRDVVMSVDVSGDGRWVVTGSKDRTVRVWEGGGEWRCVGSV